MSSDYIFGDALIEFYPYYYGYSATENFKNLEIKIYDNLANHLETVYTNSSGDYQSTYQYTGVYVIHYNEVKGKYAFVVNHGDVEYEHELNAYPGYAVEQISIGLNINSDPNVYFHVNEMHNYFTSSPFNYTTMNYTMVAHTDIGSGESHYSNGTDIYFGTLSGLPYDGTRTVIGHEYAHCVIHHLYGGWIGTTSTTQAAAMNEGLADYFAISDAGLDSWGDNCYAPANVREYDNDWVYVQGQDKYRNAQVIGGACWDLRESGIGVSNADKLVFDALQMTPHAYNFEDFAENIAIADDNDANVFNGYPHYNQIKAAFETNHGIDVVEPYTSSGTLTENETWSGSNNLIGNITVPNGITLTISPGTNIQVGANLEIIIQSGGSLIAIGTTYNKITFTRSGGTDWKGILIESNNITMEYCDIDYTTDGIRVNGATGFTLKDSEIWDSNNYGVYFYNSSSGYLEDNVIKYCYGAGVRVDGSTANLKHNDIDYCYYGIYLNDGIINMPNQSMDEYGLNHIHNSTSYTFYGLNGSVGNWGLYNDGGNNAIIKNAPIGYLSNSTADAEYNWWGADNIDTDDFSLVGMSGIELNPALTQFPAGINKAAVPIAENNNEAKKLYLSALRQSDPDNSLAEWNAYKEVIEKYPASMYARASITMMHHLNKRLTDMNFTNYLSTLIQNSPELKEYAAMISVNNLLKKKNIYDAVERCGYLLKNESFKPYALHKLIEINLSYLGNEQEAKKCLDELRKADKDNNYISDSEKMMTDFNSGKIKPKLSAAEIAEVENNRLAKAAEEIPEEFGLLSNYPNPFNPVTNIRFALPEASNVKLIVYNMLGQEVARLVDGPMSAGFKEVTWNASDFASGMYICKMEAGSFSQAMKIMLVK